MKRLLRAYAISLLSLYFVSQITQGLLFENGLSTFLLTALGLTIVHLIAKPVINILLLPLNLITFGLFRWVSSAIALYLVTLLVKGFRITNFYFPGFTSKWFDVPEFNFGGILAFIAFSFLLSLITSFIYWLKK